MGDEIDAQGLAKIISEELEKRDDIASVSTPEGDDPAIVELGVVTQGGAAFGVTVEQV